MMKENPQLDLIDLQKLLSPVSPENPSGILLRYEGVYDEIQEARMQDDELLLQGEWKTELKVADWKSVFNIAYQALIEKTKDLQIVVWMLEAMIHLYGLKGAMEGMVALRMMSEEFWDSIFPLLEDEDCEFRVSPVVWMNGALSLSIKNIPVTSPENSDAGTYSFLDWEKIVRLQQLAKQSESARKELESETKYTSSLFQKSADATSHDFHSNSLSFIDELKKETTALETFFDKQCGKEAPSFGKFRDSLESIEVRLKSLVKTPVTEETSSSAITAEEQSEGFVAGNLTMNTTTQGREEAYLALSRIADYLLEIDPHSPAPYLVKRAVSWGDMSLGELLMELLKEGQNLQQVYSLLGIKA